MNNSEQFTLPELSDGCCDELHGEVDQAVFRTLPIKLLWFLQKDKQNVNEHSDAKLTEFRVNKIYSDSKTTCKVHDGQVKISLKDC